MQLNEWIWRGIRLQLPETWELLLFSKNTEHGSITFADRYQYRLQLAWRKMEAEPDMRRMLSDYVAQLQAANPELHVRRSDAHDWRGLRHDPVNGHVARFSRFFRAQSLLLEVIDPVAERRCDGFETEKALAGIAPAGAQDAGVWKAFGMTCRVVGDFSLGNCEVRPAMASMRFDGVRGATESFIRRGMVAHWLTGDVGEWLAAQPPAPLKKSRSGKDSLQGHDVYRLTGSFSQKPSGEWRTRARRYRAAAWICPRDGRLYYRECICPEKDDQPDTAEDTGLSCCASIHFHDSHLNYV